MGERRMSEYIRGTVMLPPCCFIPHTRKWCMLKVTNCTLVCAEKWIGQMEGQHLIPQVRVS